MTFRARLILINSGVLAVAMTGFGFGLIQLNRVLLLRNVDRELSERLESLRREPIPRRPNGLPPGRTMPGQPPPGGPGPPDEMIDFWFRPLVTFSDGSPSMDARPLDPEGLKKAQTEDRVFSFASRDGELYRVLSGRDPSIRRPPFLPDGGLLQLARPVGWINEQAQTLTQTLLFLVPVAVALGALGSFFLVGRALRPVEAMRQAAERIGETNLRERLETVGQDELAALGQTFNAMLSRLEAAFDRQRRFTADAAHELRTPLARLRLAVTHASNSEDPGELRRALDLAAQDSADLAKLIDGLMLLAQADEGVLVREMPTLDLRVPVAEALGEGVSLESPDHPIPIRGEETLLRRAVQNLIENATRYSPGPGSVTVRISASGTAAFVDVVDQGPGIALEHQHRLFDRFYRVDPSRTRGTGFGLGLAIAKAIVEAHGGRIEVESQPGHGTTFRLIFPMIESIPTRQVRTGTG